MNLRCCSAIVVELDRQPRFDFSDLLCGGSGADRSVRWMAYAPHLGAPTPVTLAQLAILEVVGSEGTCRLDALLDKFPAEQVNALLEAGLLLAEGRSPERALLVEEQTRQVAWWPLAMLAQVQGAWGGIGIEGPSTAEPGMEKLVAANGELPTHDVRCQPHQPACALLPPLKREMDALLGKRKTCRNFCSEAELTAADLATMLYRVWSATGTCEIAPGAMAVKKSSPAGGGLHCTEAYLLVQRAEGLQPGLYHYLAFEHALEPLRLMDADEAATIAHRFVAGQHWFANVPVMVVMVYRFDRLFWKYRRHAKAWRVAHLDIGHLSQTMYLSAADLGLGAFVTAAINDRDIDLELGLEPMRESSIAVVGFGPRSQETINDELDNLTATPASLRVGPNRG